ncbi:MAG TPA: tRNA 2-thiouridine(34) synthase MnmA [Actinomycetota bacterium]|nr:tRNA 2-thiouridine(34) synthase MnmA [Actinomycetota bacterium]
MSMHRKKAVVAMSGGVDSSVAAALLVEAGYDVTGIMLKLWRGDEINHDSGCCNVGAAEDARRVADVLGIPFYVHNYAERFADTVIRNFHDDYLSGRTPNPCVRCNQWIKFGTLLERASALGADVLATGHYAQVRHERGRHRLFRGADPSKDQSYVLWMLGPGDLTRVRFPVGSMRKADTRALAASLGLRTAAKPDSQEICFVRGGDLDRYVDEQLAPAAAPGPIVDTAGKLVGEHRGIARYTVGQRRGLGISLGAPVFVTALDAAGNTLTVGPRSALICRAATIAEVSLTDGRLHERMPILVQYRAHGDVVPARLTMSEEHQARVEFEGPAEAVAPGQSAAFYSVDFPDELLGGGIIASTE